MTPDQIARLRRRLPEEPGVYYMKDGRGQVLYVGKAANLKRRVLSYFSRPQDARLSRLVSETESVAYEVTASVIEALMLEAGTIKRRQPRYNIREKDDKSFLYVEITDEPFPRVRLVRGRTAPAGERFGPFTSAASVRAALHVLRHRFPYSTHGPARLGAARRPCLDVRLGLCPGTCTGAIDVKAYRKNIRGLRSVLQGKRPGLLKELERDMRRAAERREFETARDIRRQVEGLRHILDVASVAGRRRADASVAPPAQVGRYLAPAASRAALRALA